MPKLRSVDGKRWAFMVKFEIADIENPDETYLRRWRIIQTPWFGIYLHKIMLPDGDRDPHDHPWNFYSWVIKGQYGEVVLNHRGESSVNIWRRWSVHRMTTGQFHRITYLKKPTWTLLFVGPRRQNWGFMTETGWIDWETYVAQVQGRVPGGSRV